MEDLNRDIAEHTRDISDYIAIIKQRKWNIIAIISVIMVVSITIAIVWPPTYRSSATILIEQQDIPSELVRSTVTSYASERIQTIQAQVMSRANLVKVIDKFNLYADDRKKKTMSEIFEYMHEDTSLNVISADVLDPRTGRPGQATIAFELSYEGEIPQTVQRVTSELTSLYLSENLKSRSEKAVEASNFLNEESVRLGENISELEENLASFKQENADLLPEVQRFNMQQLQRLETEKAILASSIQSLKEKKFYLENQLAALGTSLPGAADRLQLLEAEYASSIARYSSDHPDVQRLKREIDALKGQPESKIVGTSIDDESKKLKLELLKLKERYSDSHPDVIRINEKIKSIESGLKNKSGSENDLSSSSPAYSSLNNQIESMAIELRIAEENSRIINEKIIDLEDKLVRGPQIERAYLALTRDYENAVVRYQETKAKGMEADVARQLETENKGERFTLIDPPALPEKPIKPNRFAIIFLGLVLSLGSGIGYALAADLLSGVVRGVKNIEVLLGVAPLSVIPFHRNASDILKASKIRKRMILISAISIIIALAIFHFLISPLDVLWFRLLRKLDGVAS